MKTHYQFAIAGLGFYLCAAGTAFAGEQFGAELDCLHFLTHYISFGSAVRFNERPDKVHSTTNAAVDDKGNVFVATQTQGSNKNFIVLTKDGIFSIPIGDKWISDPFKEKNAKVNPSKWYSHSSFAEMARTYGIELPNNQKIVVNLDTSTYKDGGNGSDDHIRSDVFAPDVVSSFQKSEFTNDGLVLGKAQEAMTPQTKSVIYSEMQLAIKNFSKNYFDPINRSDPSYDKKRNMELTQDALANGTKACSSVEDSNTKKLAQDTFATIEQDMSRRNPAGSSGSSTSSAGKAK